MCSGGGGGIELRERVGGLAFKGKVSIERSKGRVVAKEGHTSK